MRKFAHLLPIPPSPREVAAAASQYKEVELTEDERAILYFTSCYKNSYGGETDLRRKEAGRCGYRLTKERWAEVQEGLKRRGLLNKTGALTMDGRNACPNSMEYKHVSQIPAIQ